jgi:hypothetical protein
LSIPSGFGSVRERWEQWSAGQSVFKAGLLNRLDFEFGLDGYTSVHAKFYAAGYLPGTHDADGFGDVSTRLKWNIWGNDAGRTALSLSGVVVYPTASDDLAQTDYRGGPSLELAAQLPCAFELRIDSQAILYPTHPFTIGGSGRTDIQAELVNLISLSHRIVGNLNGYAMFAAYSYTLDIDWRAYVKTGLNWRVAKNIELYAGSSFGVHGPAWDYNPFVGIGARF